MSPTAKKNGGEDTREGYRGQKGRIGREEGEKPVERGDVESNGSLRQFFQRRSGSRVSLVLFFFLIFLINYRY